MAYPISAKSKGLVKSSSRKVNATSQQRRVLAFPNRIGLVRQYSPRPMTQHDLGRILCVSARQVRRIERGEVNLSAARLKIIADALGVPVDDLYPATRGARQ